MKKWFDSLTAALRETQTGWKISTISDGKIFAVESYGSEQRVFFLAGLCLIYDDVAGDRQSVYLPEDGHIDDLLFLTVFGIIVRNAAISGTIARVVEKLNEN